MTGLAIASILIGVALPIFAVHPPVAFLLEAGWKFKGDTAPSDAHVGRNLAVQAGAGVIAIVMGIVLLSQSSDSASR